MNALLEMNPSLSLMPENIFILNDGVLKIIHEDIADQEWRKVLIKAGMAYYAPEKIDRLNHGD